MNKKLIGWGHLIFWLLLILSDAMPGFLSNSYSSFQDQPVGILLFFKYLVVATAYTTISASCFYGSYFLVASRLFTNNFARKDYVKATSFTLLVYLGTVGLRYGIEFYFLKPLIGFDNYRVAPDIYYYFKNIFFFYMPSYFVYGLMYFFAESWFTNSQRQQEILKEKLTAELAFLRSQINPHYLFNTLNDIYVLTYQKAPEAPEALLKLSEVLRYMLKESQTNSMPLSKEIDYLENVIELQRIGAKGNAFINLEIKGQISGVEVASLLFIAFVENAFKHGVLLDPHHPVEIKLTVQENRLTFFCSNKRNQDQKDKTVGIGLVNVKRRLELLYEGNHQLEFDITAEHYTVTLTLTLI
jgi:two-component system LytT family sensor kinase